MNKTMTAAALMALAGTAHAADDNQLRPYVGAELTQVMADYKTVTALGVSGDDLLDDSLTGVSPYVGLQVNKYLGVELSYLRTAEGKKSDIFGSGLDTKTKVSGFGADVVGTLPVTSDERFSLLGSAGIGRYKADVEVTNGVATASDDSTDTGFRVGAGAQYQLTDNLGVRATARYIKVDFDDTTDNLVTAGVGVNYRF